MTWLYVPSNFAPDTEASPSDSETTEYRPWLTLSGTATQRPLSSPVWQKRGWIRRLYGTISAPLTAQRGVDGWISSLPVSHASHSQQQGTSAVSMMSDGSGRTLPGSLLTFDPDTSSWRTSPDLFGQVLHTSSQTLPPSGSMRNGVCCPQPPLAPLTDANESGSWPTPDATSGQRPSTIDHGKLARGFGPALVDAALMWPTPTAHDAKGPAPHDLTSNTVLLPMAATMWPTPRASMNENRTTKHAPSHGVTHGRTLAGEAATFPILTELMGLLGQTGSHLAQTTEPDGKPGQPRADLNPQFVAALMGVPKDWLTPYTSEETA